MDDQYLLRCEWGVGISPMHWQGSFTAASPREAEEKGRSLVEEKQGRLVELYREKSKREDTVLDPPIIKGEIYHLIAKVDGEQFFEKVPVEISAK